MRHDAETWVVIVSPQYVSDHPASLFANNFEKLSRPDTVCRIPIATAVGEVVNHIGLRFKNKDIY